MLDANIIRGQLTTNILLTLGEHDIIEPHWSQEVLDEARRNRPKRMPEEEFDHRLQAMNGFFPEAMVSGYEDLKPHMQAHEDDRHVLAAAVHGRCDTLVTENTKHFSPPAHGAHAMRVSRLSGLLVRKLNEQLGRLSPPCKPWSRRTAAHRGRSHRLSTRWPTSA